MLSAAGLEGLFKTHGDKINWGLDAASDNIGEGDKQRAMDAMSSKGGLLHSATISRTMWAAARKDLTKCGLNGPLSRFYANADHKALVSDLRWRRMAMRRAASDALRLRKEELQVAENAAKIARQLADAAGAEAARLIAEQKQLQTEDAMAASQAATAAANAAKQTATAAEQEANAKKRRRAQGDHSVPAAEAAHDTVLVFAPRLPPMELDTSGPIMKCPETMQPRLHHMYSKKIIKTLIRQMLMRWCWLKLRYHSTVPRCCKGFRLALKQWRMQTCVKRGSALYGKSWIEPDTLKEFPSFLSVFSRQSMVSMKQNPVRFWPCRDQRRPGSPDAEPVREYHGISNHCVHHRTHNSVSRFLACLDPDFIDRVISVVKWLINDNNVQQILDAVNFCLDENSPVNEETDWYTSFRREVNDAAVKGLGRSVAQTKLDIGYDSLEGAKAPVTCAQVRWGTTTASSAYLATYDDILAVAVLRKCGIGKTDNDEVLAAAAILSHRGFNHAEHSNVVMDPRPALVFKFLISPQAKVQRAIVCFLYDLVIHPLMTAASEALECSDRMMGMGCIPRRLLQILLRTIWVTTAGSKRRMALGHRTDGAEFVFEENPLRLLNPKCGEAVRGMMGEGWGEGMLNSMSNAVAVLVQRLQRVCLMDGNAIPDTMEKIMLAVKVINAQGSDMETRFPVKMARLQFMVWHVVQDVACEMREAFEREIMGAQSFAGGMTKSVTTSETVNGKPILYAHCEALANAVIVKVMGRDILSHYSAQMHGGPLAGRDALDFFPYFAERLWGQEGSKSLDEFLGIARSDSSNTNDHFNHVSSLKAKDADGKDVRIIDGKDSFPKALASFKNAWEAATRARNTAVSAKSIEQHWARVSLLQSTRKSAAFSTINGWFVGPNHQSMNMDISKLEQDVVRVTAARELAMHSGWKYILGIDSAVRDAMHADSKAAKLRGKNEAFWNTRHLKGSYRTDRNLRSLSATEKAALDKKIDVISRRMGKKRSGFEEQALESSAFSPTDDHPGEDPSEPVLDCPMGENTATDAEVSTNSNEIGPGSQVVSRGDGGPESEDSDSGPAESEESESESDASCGDCDCDGRPWDDQCVKEKVWTLEFCVNCWAGAGHPWEKHKDHVWHKSEVTFRGSGVFGLEATVKRKATARLLGFLKKFDGTDPAITFTVQQQSGKLHYICFSNYSGSMLVAVDRIHRPVEIAEHVEQGDGGEISSQSDWSKTMHYRRLFTTQEAIMNSDHDRDEGNRLGRESLRRLIKSSPSNAVNYHVGERLYEGDIRDIIGVVRWVPIKAKKPESGYFKEYLQSDMLVVADGCRQKKD
jgi:hypothetical protein